MIQFVKYTAFAALAALAAALGGCSSDPVPDAGEVILRLHVDTGLGQTSRATDPDRFEPAEGAFENINTLRVIIVNGVASGNPLGEVEVNKLVSTTPEGYPVNDNMEFKVKTGRKRIYLIANEGSLPVPEGQNFTSARLFLDSFQEGYDFDAEVFTLWTVELPGSNPEAKKNLYSNVAGATGLPLTEYFDIAVESFKSKDTPGAGSSTDLTDIETQYVHLFLTRAAAKATYTVKVADGYKASGAKVTGIRLNGLNWAQYVFPRATTYSPAKEAKISYEQPIQVSTPTNRYITSFTTPERDNAVAGATLTMELPDNKAISLTTNTTATTDPIYFPESLFPQAASATDRFTVSVQIDGGAWLPAKPLEDNLLQVTTTTTGENPQTYTRYGIARSTHMVINIEFTGKEITWRAVVAPYNSVKLDPVFGLIDEELKNKNNN